MQEHLHLCMLHHVSLCKAAPCFPLYGVPLLSWHAAAPLFSLHAATRFPLHASPLFPLHAAPVQTYSGMLCCADLFTGNGGQIAVGVVLVILLPLGFLLASAFFIWRYLYHPRAHQRRAAFILLENPDEPMVCCLLLSLLLLLVHLLLLLLLYTCPMSECPGWPCLLS